MKSRMYFLSSLLACALLFYAIPRFSLMNPQLDAQFIFTVAWFLFAFMVIGAQLYRLLGMDDETEAKLEKIKQLKRKRQEEMWQRMMGESRQRMR